MAGGRPSKYKPEYCEQLFEHMKGGLSFVSFGAVIRVDGATLDRWVKEFPEFCASKKEGRAAQVLFYEQFGRSAMAGKIKNFNATAFVWMTKNMLGWSDKIEVHQEIEPITLRIKGEKGLYQLGIGISSEAGKSVEE